LVKSREFTELSNEKFVKSILGKRRDSLHELFHYTAIKEADGFALIAVIGHSAGNADWLKTTVSPDLNMQSLSAEWPAALWLEREITDKTGIRIPDHPDLKPILYPETRIPGGTAHGSGTFHMPLGPVRGDVMESLLYMFDILGEQIMYLETQLFYKHRQVEELARGKTPEQALLLAERIAGTSTVAHSAAFAGAAEQALGIGVTKRTANERLLLGELERLYNHAGDISLLAGSTGMTVGQAQLARVKEELLRINADLSGSRYLRGTVRIGKPSGIVWKIQTNPCAEKLVGISERFERFTADLSRTPTFIDRLKGTGKVETKWAKSLDIVGPVARANGVPQDIRFDYLKDALELENLQLVTDPKGAGDALSRYNVRVEEWRQSFLLIQSLMTKLSDPDFGQEEWKGNGLESPIGWGHGIVESPRGRTSHILRIDSEGKIDEWNVRSASGSNWPVFGLAVANGNIQTDFPIIETSFALSVASCDR
jgi:Ni,Fe-hydrogenase III large subunit